MSAFSEVLRKTTQDHNIVITRLAQTAEIDRTTLQHILSGKRMPNKEQMNKLIHTIPIPPRAKMQLLQAYEIAEYGADKFRQREKIKEIIEKVAFASALKPNTAASLQSIPMSSANETEDLYGILAINDALTRILHAEKESLTFFMPSSFPFFYDALFTRYTACSTLTVTCLLSLSNAKNSTMKNLEYLEAFIPFFASPKRGFQAHYIYGDGFSHDILAVPFPYFICTNRYTLALSAEMDCAILTKSEAIMRAYRKICQNFLNLATSLYVSPSLSELLDLYPKCDSSRKIFSAIENQPCFQWYLDEETIQKYAIANSAEDAALIRKYTDYIFELRKEPNFSTVFGQEGLDFFVETGRIAVWPPHLSRPLDISDRINFLRLMLHDIEKDKFHCRLANTSKFTVPHHTSNIGVRGKTVIIECLDYVTPNVKNICLTEEFIVDAFTDFFLHLPNTNLVHSKDDTMKVIETALAKLESEASCQKAIMHPVPGN